MRASKSYLLLLPAAVLAACAPKLQPPPPEVPMPAVATLTERELAFRSVLEDSVRLHEVGGQILRAGAGLCGDRVKASVGMAFATVHDFPPGWRDAARRVAKSGERPRVLFVVPGAPAASAGLARGDEIHAVGGRRVAAGSEATKAMARVIATRRLETVANAPFTMTVLKPRPKKVALGPDRVCDFTIVLGPEETVDAVADGSRIMVSRGMMRLVRGDAELALVIAHELAHNVLHHIDEKRTRASAGGLVGAMSDAFAAADDIHGEDLGPVSGGEAERVAYSKEFEVEADYIGLFVLARGGFDIKIAPSFWSRLAAVSPTSADFARAHPIWPMRFARLRNAIAEIGEKTVAGLPLELNLERWAAGEAGLDRQQALGRKQSKVVLAGAGKFMKHFHDRAFRVSIRGPYDVHIRLGDQFSGQPEFVAGALCASIKEAGPLPAGPVIITLGDEREGKRHGGFPCE